MTRQAKRILRHLMQHGHERMSIEELRVRLRMPEGTLRRELPILCRDLFVYQSEDRPARYSVTKRAYSLRLS